MTQSDSCLVLGAGISALLAAQSLQQAGRQVTLLEKARGVGGRMATRRVGAGAFDHGAQFFTVRSARFQDLVDVWARAGIVEIWSHGFIQDEDEKPYAGHPRYRGIPGMTGIPKHISKGLDIRLQTRATAIRRTANGWNVETESGEIFASGALVLTAPVPQSLTLLAAGGTDLTRGMRQELEKIQYDPCIALVVETSTQGRVPEPGAIRLTTGDVQWVADNFRKGVSNVFGLTMHTSPEFSSANWEKEKSELAEMMIELVQPWLGGEVLGWSVQKWRYSQPRSSYPEKCLVVPGEHPLIFAGDAFGGARVEGAALSGLRAADELLKKI